MPWTTIALLALTLAQGPEPAPAEQAQEPRPGVPLWHFMQEEVSLANLVDLCAQQRGIAIEHERSKLEAEKVRVQPSLGLTALELWRLTNRSLALRGLAIVQAPGADGLSVVSMAQAASLARLEVAGIASARAGYVRVLAQLRHRRSEGLAEALRLVLSKDGGQVVELRDAQALVISDLFWHVEQALALLTALDQPSAEPVVQELALARASPLTLAAQVERVAAARRAVTPAAELKGKLQALPESNSVLVVAPEGEMEVWRELVQRFDRSEPLVTEHYAPRRFGLAETARLVQEVVHPPDSTRDPGSWRLVVDRLTGTLIVTATPSRQREVRELVARLESTPQGAERPMRSFAIRNRRVGEVLGVLKELLDAGVIAVPAGGGATLESGVQGATAPIARAVPSSEDAERALVLAADEATSRILAFGEPALLDQLGPLIERIDVRHAQILVDALVITLSESRSRELAVELQRLGVAGDTLYRLSTLFGVGSPDPAAAALPAPGGTGFSGVVLDPGDSSAAVRALEALNEGRSLAIQKVLVDNNQEARLDSVQESPFLSTNASQTVATTSYGGSLEAGTKIHVKPQVAEGDLVLLEYTVSLSTFTGEPANPELPPPRQQNELASVVTVPDGFSVVVGGLEVETETEVATRVPLLGAIPGLGALFTSTRTSLTKARFFVFLRASVLRSPSFADLKYLSARELSGVGLDDGWPRIEPKVIR